ncbi:MAG: hypothetical protein RSC43_01090 [Clostridia bacterium]
METFKDILSARKYIKESEAALAVGTYTETQLREALYALQEVYSLYVPSEKLARYYEEVHCLISHACACKVISSNLKSVMQSCNNELYKGDYKRYVNSGEVLIEFSTSFGTYAAQEFNPYDKHSISDVSKSINVARKYLKFMHSAVGIRIIMNKFSEVCAEYQETNSIECRDKLTSVLRMLHVLGLLSENSRVALTEDMEKHSKTLYADTVKALTMPGQSEEAELKSLLLTKNAARKEPTKTNKF